MVTLLAYLFFLSNRKLKLKWSYEQNIEKVQTKKSPIHIFENKQYKKHMWHNIILIIVQKKIYWLFTYVRHHHIDIVAKSWKDHWKTNIFTVLNDNNDV